MTLNLSLLERERLDGLVKGYPISASPLSITEIGGQGWNLRSPEIALPLIAIRPAAVLHNIRVMQSLCDDHLALLAPQIKSTLAPQIMQWQEEAGAWGFTASAPAHLELAAQFGMQRLICESLPPGDTCEGRLVELLKRHVEVIVIVDSVEAARSLARAVTQSASGAGVDCVLAAGSDQFDAAAAAVAEARPALTVAGVAFDGHQASLADAVSALRAKGWLEESFVVSLGERSDLSDSIAFVSGRWPSAHVVVRPGCYVADPTSDEQLSLDLRPAIELWTDVIADSGNGLPMPIRRAAPERIVCGLEDACRALVRWQLALAVDDDDNVIGAIRVWS